MNTKLFLQVLLLAGCVALLFAVAESVLIFRWLREPRGWWEAAVACWLLVIAVRVVYPDRAK
jgi:hypothetical protein